MNTITSKFVAIGGLFLLTLISGVVLSLMGKPLNTAVFTIHKLAAMGGIILLAVNIFNLNKVVDVNALNLTMIIISGVLFLGLIVSGAFLSFEKPALLVFVRVHQIVPVLALVSAAVSVYLLIGGEALSRAGVLR